MSKPIVLLKCVGKAVLKAGFGLMGGFAGELLAELAHAAWDAWNQQCGDRQKRAEIERLAQAQPGDIQAQVADVVQELAADQPPEVRQTLAAYLQQMPATVRQSLRRPADPAGQTVPSGLPLRGPEDLLALLPSRLPRFHPGERPPGIGDWELVELLGMGGFGEVWKARNPHLASVPPVALKFCLDPQAAQWLRHEAAVLDRVMRQGKHPGIVQLQHTYLGTEPPCLEYELVEGGDLAGLIREQQARGGMSIEEAGRTLLQLADIVGHAHRLHPPIVHRDLKPANILVQRGTGGAHRLKIADFGIGGLAAREAIATHTRGQTSRGAFLGTMVRGACTPLYASPQQIRGEAPDPRDDVHALGVIWYQLLTGDLGAGAPTGRRWVEGLRRRGMTEAGLDLLASCVESRAQDRPENASVLADCLSTLNRAPPPPFVQTQEPAPPPPVRPAAPPPPPPPVQPRPKPPPPAATPKASAPSPKASTPSPKPGEKPPDQSWKGCALLILIAVGIGVWNYLRNQPQTTIELGSMVPHGPMAFSADGRRLMVGQEGVVNVWDAEGGKKRLASWDLKSNLHVFAPSPQGDRLATGTDDGLVRLYAGNGGSPLTVFEGHEGAINTLAFSPDGKQLAGGGGRHSSTGALGPPPGPKNVLIWDVSDGPSVRPRHVLSGHEGYIYCLAYLGDNQRLASGSSDGTIRIWDTVQGRELSRWKTPSGVGQMAYNPGTGQIVTLAGDGIIRFWDPKTQRQVHEQKIDGTKTGMFQARLSPDGSKLAAGGYTNVGRVLVWNTRTGEELQAMWQQPNGTDGLAFSPDGKRLAARGADGKWISSVRIWKLKEK